MAKQNNLNRESQDFTVDPGAAGGDSFVQFDIITAGKFRIGVDDDAADSFKISLGSSLGINDTFIMTPGGIRSMPLQPAFLAYLGTSVASVTGNSAIYTLGSGTALTEVFDQNNDFDTSGIFTAPVAGKYLLTAALQTTNSLSNLMENCSLRIVTNEYSYTFYINPYLSQAIGTGASLCVTGIAEMQAGHTARVTFQIIGGAGNTAGVFGGTPLGTYFAGSLLV